MQVPDHMRKRRHQWQVHQSHANSFDTTSSSVGVVFIDRNVQITGADGKLLIR